MTDEEKESAIQEALSEWRRLAEITEQAWRVSEEKHREWEQVLEIAKKADFETTGAHNRMKRLVRGVEE